MRLFSSFNTAAMVLAIGLAVAGPSASSAFASTIEGQAQVHDGDTLRIGKQSIRLWGIDAAELKQNCRVSQTTIVPCGQLAQKALENLIAGQDVTCITKGKSYNRAVAVCYVGKQDLAQRMTQLGMAFDYEQYSRGTYAPDEEWARTQTSGLWAMEFIEPATWRKCFLHRSKKNRDAIPPSCAFR